MLIIQGYVIMAGAFMAIPIYEKEKNIRRVFNSRGISPLAYWFGTFIFGFSFFLINLFIISKLITPASFKFTQSSPSRMLIICELGVGMIIYTYAISNLFEKIKTPNTWFFILNMLMGIVVLPMSIIGKDTWLGYFGFVKYIYPYYDLTSLMIN